MKDDARPLLSPSRIVARLSERVVGQSLAKQKLAGALWWNGHRRLLVANGIDPHTIPPRQNVLLAGPSGTGKTLLVKAAAELFGVPFFATPATSYSRVGYVGLNPEDMIGGLLHQAGGEVPACQRGIVLLDEVDKLRRRDLGGHDDVGGEAVQQMLLTLLEGITVQVKKPGGDEKVRIDTSGITFVAAGAFDGLDDVVLRRLHRRPEVEGEALDEEAYRHLSADDLVDFGLIPEFVARFGVRAGLVPLTRGQLGQLLRDFASSPLRQAVNLFALHGIELAVEPSAVESILERAMAERTGARALTEVLNDRLMHVVNALPDLLEEGVTRAIVDRDCLERGAAPWKIAGEPNDAAVDMGDLAKRHGEDEPATRAGLPVGVSDTKEWSEGRLRERLARVKASLDWEATTGSARKWWDAFERENSRRLGMVLRLAEELAARKATLTEFFLAYVYSNTDNIQANLHYLDYARLKKEDERRKKDKAKPKADVRRFRSGEPCPSGCEGEFEFDGYLDGSTGDEPRDATIAVAVSEAFPTAGLQDKACWWKRAARDQRSAAE